MLPAVGQFVPLPPAAAPIPLKPGATVSASATDDRTRAAAKEFEATFLSLLLKEMRQTLEPDGGLFAGDSGDVQGGLFDLLLGQHLADAGGVGFATAIARNLRYPPNARTPSLPAPAGAGAVGQTAT
jgi:flagellar protein FlgJ